jgi:septum formation protein
MEGRSLNQPGLPLILASASPRRAELMRAHGYDFSVVVPPYGEPDEVDGRLHPAEWAEALSYFKARSVTQSRIEGVVIGADTIAALEGRCIGKPANREDARRIITALAGTTHDVITGVTVVVAGTAQRLIRHERTSVAMRAMTDGQIEAYLATGAWAGKAGAYGIQDHGDAFIESISGSFTNVVGLPMELLARMLADFGITAADGAADDATIGRSEDQPSISES